MSGRPLPLMQWVVVAALSALLVTMSLGSGSAVRSVLLAEPITAPVPTTGAPAAFGFQASPHVEVALTAEEVARLPEARYDAVIAGLIGYARDAPPTEMGIAYTVNADTAIYGVGRIRPVARIGALNFLGEKTVVVPVSFFEGWALILTPARQSLPSASVRVAPAQTAGWIRTEALIIDHLVPDRIIVSVTDQTLSIVDRDGEVTAVFSIGVGTPSTPTPTGVTGYIQALYLDPAQGQDTHPIALTSLHSAAFDEPYGGSDGGLIGVHYFLENTGAVSHGCLRLSEDAIVAVNSLPIGTPISIID